MGYGGCCGNHRGGGSKGGGEIGGGGGGGCGNHGCFYGPRNGGLEMVSAHPRPVPLGLQKYLLHDVAADWSPIDIDGQEGHEPQLSPQQITISNHSSR